MKIYEKLIQYLKTDCDLFFVVWFSSHIKNIYCFSKKLNEYLKFCNNEHIMHNEFISFIRDNKCKPFWNDAIRKKSDNMYLPTNDFLEKSKTSEKIFKNSWFGTEFYTNNHKKKYDAIEIKRKRKFQDSSKNNKCMKIKLYLTHHQRKYLIQIMGIYRYYYNRTIQYINNYDKKTQTTYFLIDVKNPDSKIVIDLKDEACKFNFINVRAKIQNNEPKWMEEIKKHCHLKAQAIMEACTKFKICIKLFEKNKKSFSLKMKKKKDKYQTMNIENDMFKPYAKTDNKRILFGSILGENGKKLFENLKMSGDYNKIKHNKMLSSSITYNKNLDEFYLNYNYIDKKKKNNDILRNKKVVSIDPGIKTMLSCYSDDGISFLGFDKNKVIHKLCKEVDILQSNINKKKEDVGGSKKYKFKSSKRRSMKKAMHRKIKKIQDMKNDLISKNIKYLVDNYGRIILPNLKIKEMGEKFKGKLARSLYNLSFCKFMTKLKVRCKEYDVEIITKEEYYTSKTCTRCGNIKWNLKLNDRIYKCEKCKLEIDRDINAARNIMLRNN